MTPAAVPPPSVDETRAPDVWWSPSHDRLYTLYDGPDLRSIHETEEAPADAVELVPAAAPSPEAIERAARAARDAFKVGTLYGPWADAGKHAQHRWRDVASAVAAALTETGEQP